MQQEAAMHLTAANDNRIPSARQESCDQRCRMLTTETGAWTIQIDNGPRFGEFEDEEQALVFSRILRAALIERSAPVKATA